MYWWRGPPGVGGVYSLPVSVCGVGRDCDCMGVCSFLDVLRSDVNCGSGKRGKNFWDKP